MINNYFIWDKESPINGASAKDVLASDSKFINNTVVFFTENGKPSRHAFVYDLRLELNMQDKTDEEICQAYFEKIKLDEENKQKEQIILEQQAIKIDILEEQNKESKDKISILEAENSKLLLDSAIKKNEIDTLDKNTANLTLEIAKMKGGM